MLYLILQAVGTVAVMGDSNAVLWFDPAGGALVPRFAVRQALTAPFKDSMKT